MKLLIFGATGGVGYQLVKQALDRGHTVTAFARDLQSSISNTQT
jgi:putative NADH-flavin reductase